MSRAWVGILLLSTSCLDSERSSSSSAPPPEAQEVLAVRITFGDFDGDGVSEIATLSNGIVSPPGMPIDAWDLAAADLDGDGRDELLAATPSGVVQLPDLIPFGMIADEIRVGDLNGDGRDDLVTSGIDGLCVWIAPTFRAESLGASAPFAIGDIDGDGKDEVVFLEGGTYQVYGGEADPYSYAPATELESTETASFTCVAVGAEGRILLGGASCVRIVARDRSFLDIASPAVRAIMEWNGSAVILDDVGTVRILREGSWAELATGITSLAVEEGRLYLLR